MVRAPVPGDYRVPAKGGLLTALSVPVPVSCFLPKSADKRRREGELSDDEADASGDGRQRRETAANWGCPDTDTKIDPDTATVTETGATTQLIEQVRGNGSL